ncbi:hypothetical protein CXG81DRAFT_25312 [Caulochytrium protostelioides]|uniref:Uncharacterized protein n=1 Tax=Caulochytrium protostelioides TaxID=1555241 RepID=A0A4V1IUW9_9FUNG|nr:hypothetical protein CXG81DRAFT_25312 [Caulochytrium protostelioides]|eukprot:RKP02019.1 hypothetical protein CXG81DRAFT_25312 [Caulochytrium protostelioides]
MSAASASATPIIEGLEPQRDIYFRLFLASYLIFTVHFMYAFVMGPIYQWRSMRRHPKNHDQWRMTLSTATRAWMLCGLVSSLMLILPISVVRHTSSSGQWHDRAAQYWNEHLARDFEPVSVLMFLVTWLLVNREILILIGLSFCGRWPLPPSEEDIAAMKAKQPPQTPVQRTLAGDSVFRLQLRREMCASDLAESGDDLRSESSYSLRRTRSLLNASDTESIYVAREIEVTSFLNDPAIERFVLDNGILHHRKSSPDAIDSTLAPVGTALSDTSSRGAGMAPGSRPVTRQQVLPLHSPAFSDRDPPSKIEDLACETAADDALATPMSAAASVSAAAGTTAAWPLGASDSPSGSFSAHRRYYTSPFKRGSQSRLTAAAASSAQAAAAQRHGDPLHRIRSVARRHSTSTRRPRHQPAGNDPEAPEGPTTSELCSLALTHLYPSYGWLAGASPLQPLPSLLRGQVEARGTARGSGSALRHAVVGDPGFMHDEAKLDRRLPSSSHQVSSLRMSTSWAKECANGEGIWRGYEGMRHGFIIAAHNSSSALVETLASLLKLTTPRTIFIADNGSSTEEIAKTHQVAKAAYETFCQQHPTYNGAAINIGVLKEGSKNIAQFSVLNSLAYLGSEIEFISLLDDDTTLPDEWREDYVLALFDQDPLVQCLAYPLESVNGNRGRLLETFQNFEYRIAMFIKCAQASLATAFFPSGAISTWRAPMLLDILSRHDTLFRGDDLQMGLLLHTFYRHPSYLNPMLKHPGNYSIKMAPYTIKTIVPQHWFHLRDLFPRTAWRYFGASCACGEPSLFYQRARSWEVARHRFFRKFVQSATHPQHWSHGSTWFAKCCALDSIISVLGDFGQIVAIIIIVSWHSNYISLGVLMLSSFAAQAVAFDLVNVMVLERADATRIPVEIRALYSVFYALPANLIIKQAAIIYNYLHYLPMVRTGRSVGKRAREGRLGVMEVTWSSTEDAHEGVAQAGHIADRLHVQRRGRRTRTNRTSFAPPPPPPPSPVPSSSTYGAIHATTWGVAQPDIDIALAADESVEAAKALQFPDMYVSSTTATLLATPTPRTTATTATTSKTATTLTPTPTLSEKGGNDARILREIVLSDHVLRAGWATDMAPVGLAGSLEASLRAPWFLARSAATPTTTAAIAAGRHPAATALDRSRSWAHHRQRQRLRHTALAALMGAEACSLGPLPRLMHGLALTLSALTPPVSDGESAAAGPVRGCVTPPPFGWSEPRHTDADAVDVDGPDAATAHVDVSGDEGAIRVGADLNSGMVMPANGVSFDGIATAPSGPPATE